MNAPIEPARLPTNLRIVLVGTQHPGNIGSAARAMKTMGLSRLVLVAPEKAPDRDTQAMAAGADDVLEAAPVFATPGRGGGRLPLVLGCTARSRRIALEQLHPRDAAGRAVLAAASGPVALVFGRERTGLDNEELQLCHAAVHIPSNPALQLAQPRRGGAGAELTSCVAPCWGMPAPPVMHARRHRARVPASHAQLEGLFGQLAETLDADRLPQGARAGVGDAQAAPAVPARQPRQRRGPPAARRAGRCPADGAAGRAGVQTTAKSVSLVAGKRRRNRLHPCAA